MRINFYGGPGVGKSTMAARIFAELKRRGFNAEHVQEYVKSWAYEGRDVTGFDQLYFFAKQMKKEHSLLANGVKIVVTDSPLLMSVCYAAKYDFPEVDALETIAESFDSIYPSIDILLTREGKDYKQMGRFETEMEARLMDDIIRGTLERHSIDYKSFNHDDFEEVVDYILEELGQ